MTLKQVMAELKSLGNPRQVQVYRRHGADGDMFGVRIGDLKNVLKKIKGNQQLALELWDTGNADAMYLAALVADGSQMTKKQLDGWVKTAWWSMLSSYSVPWVTSEHPDGAAIATKWIKSKKESIASAGWMTYGAVVSIWPDAEIDLKEVRGLLKQVETNIKKAPDTVRYCMNDFVIAVGSYIKPLHKAAKATAKKIGIVDVDMGDTSCKVPVATDVIEKVESKGRVGKKRKTAKC